MIKTLIFNIFLTSECIQFFVDAYEIYVENKAEALNLVGQQASLQ